MMRTATVCALLLLWAVPGSGDQREGATLFRSICAKCHGNDGVPRATTGEKMHIPDLRSEEVQSRSDSELFDSIGHGIGHKEYPHGFLHRGMTDKDVRDLVTHIRTLRKK